MSRSTAKTNVASRLANAYFNIASPGGYAGVAALQRAVPNTSKREVTQWLHKQRTYTLHKPARKHYPTRHYQVTRRDQQWQADLVEMIPYARKNRGYRYMLTVIDILSRYAWAEPIKTKTAGEIVRAFKAIFRRDGRVPRFIQTDQGKEFENAPVRAFLATKQVELFSVKSAYKAAMVERLNRTLKNRMWRYFTHNATRKWIDILPDLLRGYNNSHHRVIGRPPATVTPANEMQVWNHLYGKKKKPTSRRSKFQVGDLVRLSKVKSLFDKGYLPNWSEEEFVIEAVDRKYSPIMYTVRDLNGETIEGKFYPQELQRIENPEGIYAVERVLRRRHRPGQAPEVLVKWFGYPTTSWIKTSALINKPPD